MHDTVITYGTFFKNRNVLVQQLSLLIGYSGFNYITPVFANNLYQQYGVDVSLVGLCFAIVPLAAALSGPFFGKLCKKFGRPAITTLGFSLMWLAQNFIGPTSYLHIPSGLWSNLVGFVFLGMGVIAVQVSSLREICAVVDDEVTY
jgi:MFS family permease